MSREANIATELRMIEAVNRGDLRVLHEIFAPDVIDHDAAPGQEQGAEGFIRFFEQLREAFPDLQVAIEHLVADESDVAIAVTVTGTHLGPFRGLASTGRKVQIRGLQIATFDDQARLKSRWGSSDELGLLRQLGISNVKDDMASLDS